MLDLIAKTETLKANAGVESDTDVDLVVSRAIKQRILGPIESDAQ